MSIYPVDNHPFSIEVDDFIFDFDFTKTEGIVNILRYSFLRLSSPIQAYINWAENAPQCHIFKSIDANRHLLF